MSVIRTNNITNKDGTSGPTILGISTVNSSGFMRVPVGDTRTRLVRDYENIVTNGLVLHLDAGRAASYGGDGTTWRDLSGQNNNGTLQGGVGFTVDDGGSLIFDGVDDNVDTRVFAYSPYMTFSVWAKTTSSATSTSFVDFNSIDNKTIMNLGIRNTSGKLALTYNDILPILGAYPYMEGNTTINDGIWKNLVGLYDSQGPKLYINGVRENVTHYENSSDNRNGSLMQTVQTQYFRLMGLGNNPTGYRLSGNIAQVSIYNRALTASEVQQNFNALRSRYGI